MEPATTSQVQLQYPESIQQESIHTVRIGLLHASLAARAKWPEFLNDGRHIEWLSLGQMPDDQRSFDAWIIGTQGTKAQRLQSLKLLTSTPAGLGPVMVLLHPMDIHDDWLSLKADAYHESSSSAALLAQRLESLIPLATSGYATPKPIGQSLAAAESQVWQSLFDCAGAGLLTGRTASFLRAQDQILNLPPAEDRDSILARVRQLLRSVQWELNNQRSKELLSLEEPISLNSSFVDRITPLRSDRFLDGLLNLSEAQPTTQGEVVIRNQNGKTSHLSIELTLPSELEDGLLLTLLDISSRIRLEQDLREHVQHLEKHVGIRTLDIRKVNVQLEKESRNKEQLAQQVRDNFVHITQGIIGAKKILDVALPSETELLQMFPNSMYISRPRDIVGGDFFFLGNSQTKKTLALVDSTGHGIPGAMVSLMGSMLLNQAFNELTVPLPHLILQRFQANFCGLTRPTDNQPQMHGFDAAVMTIDHEKKTVEFSGARGNLFLIRDGQTTIIRGTRKSIESEPCDPQASDMDTRFEYHKLTLHEGDQLYLFSDGVTDQFGGAKGRKMGRNRLAKMLSDFHMLPISERKKAIHNALLIWKGANAKVDDATLIGVDI